MDDPIAMYLNDIFTIPANLAGMPAISVPCGLDSAGLPVGLQLTAPVLGEQTLFRAARALEGELGLDLRPPLIAAPESGLDAPPRRRTRSARRTPRSTRPRRS